jgi:hypothetical protein
MQYDLIKSFAKRNNKHTSVKILFLLLFLTLFTSQSKAETCLPYITTPSYNNSWWVWEDSNLVTITFNNQLVYGTRGGAIQTFNYGGKTYYKGSTVIFVSHGNGKNGAGAHVVYNMCYADVGPTYSYTTTQDQAASCPTDRPSGYILQRRSYEVWSDGSARNFGGWYNVADYCSAVGLYTTTQDQAAGCPADRPSGYILQRRTYEVWSDSSTRNFSGWYNVADYCSAVYNRTETQSTVFQCAPVDAQGRITSSGTYTHNRTYEVWSDGSIRNYGNYYNVNDYCAVRGSENQTLACPATMPSGTITQTRTFEYYTTTAYSYGGQRFNYTGWTTIGNTCKSIFQYNESQNQSVACPAPYAEGGNGQTQIRTREVWTDGPRLWSAWSNTGSGTTCYKTVSDVKDNSRKTCAEGQTGYRITEWRRTHKEYSINLGKTPAEIAVLNEQNATGWTEVEVANTCVNVPDKVTTEPGTRLLTCSSVYGGPAASYTGEVIESGTKVYTYSSATKQTTTTFVSKTPPSYNSTCKSTVSDVTTETNTKACPAGYSGSITSYRYVSTDANGVKTYPNGTGYIESMNTCASTGSSNDDSASVSQTIKMKGLLANNTIKTSSLNTKTDLENFINTLDKTTLDKTQNYKLHLIVDDLSTGKYNKANVVKTINAFKGATGQDPIITVPQSLDKYIGNGGITASNYKNKIFKSAELNSSNQLKVTYSELTKKLKEGAESTFTIDLLK